MKTSGHSAAKRLMVKRFLLFLLIFFVVSCRKETFRPSGIYFSGNFNYAYAIIARGNFQIPYSFESYIVGNRPAEVSWGSASPNFVLLQPGSYQVIVQKVSEENIPFGNATVTNISLATNQQQTIYLK